MATAAAAAHLLNPLATTSQIEASPSVLDGLSKEVESDLRTYGALLIQQAGIHLRAPQVVMTSASVLFQRFWFVSSMRSFSVKDIAASSLFLASKLEEHPIKIRELINCFDYLYQLVKWEEQQAVVEKARSVAASFGGSTISNTSNGSAAAGPSMGGYGKEKFVYEPMDYFAKEFYDMKDDIVIGESQILKRLGFHATVQNPYGSLVNYLQVLNLTDHPILAQTAWSLANDALLTPLLVIYPPHVISVSCIYLALLVSSPPVALPMDPAPWWTLFDVPSEEQIHEVCRTLLNVYRDWSGGTDWLGDGTKGGVKGDGVKTVWRRAAEKKLPMTKEEVRRLIEASPIRGAPL